ncbi:MAG: hypothetical protein IKX89_00595, partial [Firmicutes bacterium]|nr:hypothetical protein [Bacillota bacterium]
SLAGCSMDWITPEDGNGSSNTVKPQDHISELVIGTTLAAEDVSILSDSGAVGAFNSLCITDPALFVRNKDGKTVGYFFQDCAVAADGMELKLVFPVDKKWHDGSPVTMDDVVFTFEWLRDVKKAESLKTLTGIRKDADNQITLVFSEPAAYAFLRSEDASARLMPKHIWSGVNAFYETYSGQGYNVGCGPYKLVSADASGAVFEAVPGNGYLGDIKADKIILKTYPDETALLTALAAKEIDFVFYDGMITDSALMDIVKGSEWIDEGRTDSGSFFYAVFGRDGICGELKDLRKAVTLSIDWERIRSTIGGENGTIPGAGAVPPSAMGYDDSIAQFSTKRGDAGKILDDLGFKDADEDGLRDMPDGTRFTFRITSEDIPEMQAMLDSLGKMIAEDLRKSGIDAVYEQPAAPAEEPAEEQPAEEPSEDQPAEAAYDLVLGRAGSSGAWDWSSVISSEAIASACEAIRKASGETRYKEEMQFLQKLMSDELLGFSLCWEEGFLPYRTDEYKGFSFFPGVGALNYDTFYKIKDINKK